MINFHELISIQYVSQKFQEFFFFLNVWAHVFFYVSKYCEYFMYNFQGWERNFPTSKFINYFNFQNTAEKKIVKIEFQYV